MPTCIAFINNDVELNIYDNYGKLLNRIEFESGKLLEILKAVSGIKVVKSYTSGTIMLICEVLEGSAEIKGNRIILK
ncbi:MAG: hypothetical protein QXO98_02465 [Sulfolobales archaeon]